MIFNRRKVLTYSEYLAEKNQAGKKPHKFGAKRVEGDEGISFASQLEAAVYREHLLLQMGGEIRNLTHQDHVKLTLAQILYIADGRFEDKRLNWETVWYEAKGFETPEWKLKRRLWQHYGPGRLRVYKGSAGSFKLVEEIGPGL